MPNVQNKYESILIVSTTLGEHVSDVVNKFKELIEANGTMETVDEWGKRRLAYPINDEMEGFYVMYTFTCGPEFPAELDRVYKITEGVLRSMIINKES